VSTSRKVLSVAGGIAAGAVGVAAAGTAYRVARRRRIIARRGAGDLTPFGSLHSSPVTVVTEDGVDLHVEIDEYTARGGSARAPELTVVFVHGYSLTLDSWHFQRAAYRGRARMVFYDQRSHGRSGRSTPGHATVEQLGRDLKTVVDTVAPGPVVLVGHSMGGMTIVALAEEHPELFGDRVVGVGLISTTAGGLEPHRILVPLLPSSAVGGVVAQRLVSVLARGHRAVDGIRRVGRSVALVATDELAFGDDVPESYVEFVDRMLSATPFEVVAEFFPNFVTHDRMRTVEALSVVPTTIICGTDDKLTSVGHSRKLHAQIAGSTLIECEGAGHMVIMERHDEVNAGLDRLFAAAGARADRR
jgi:pimeloyl-ACP methyl ester carboxylesterase